MRIALVLVAVGALAFAAAGCSSARGSCSACDGSPVSNCSWGCPKMSANCCGWDFYVPCDMIEGRAQRRCGSAPYAAGQVVSRSYAVPVSPCAPPPPGAMGPMMPPPGTTVPPPTVTIPIPEPAPAPAPAQ